MWTSFLIALALGGWIIYRGSKSKSKILKWMAYFIGAIFIASGIGTLLPESSYEATAPTATTYAASPTPKSTVSEPKTPEEYVKQIVEEKGTYGELQFLDLQNGILVVGLKPKEVWDARDLVSRGLFFLSENADKIFGKFKDVQKIRVYLYGDFVKEDKYGNQTTKTELAAKFALSRDLNEKINWDVMSCKHKKTLAVLEEVYFHPAVGREVLAGTKGCWAE